MLQLVKFLRKFFFALLRFLQRCSLKWRYPGTFYCPVSSRTILKMESTGSSETPVNNYQSINCGIALAFNSKCVSSLLSAEKILFWEPTSWLGSATVKGKSNPITGLDRPREFQEVEAPRFQDSRHMKVARLSALRTGRFCPPGNIPGTHFC